MGVFYSQHCLIHHCRNHGQGDAALSDAQQLFGLKAQSFEKLNAVRKEMEVLDVIYSVYEEQKHARDEWAQALWSDLHMEVLEQGIDAFATRVRRMPDNVKEHPLWQVLSKRIKEFKDTLPLLTDLKSEALRDRHWKQLMNETNIKFDMNPNTFTLAKLFEMELHRFEDLIGDITTAAMKELNIEKGLNEIKETWRKTEFSFVKYVQGEQERGLVLGTTDDIIQLLDDNAMNLQTVAASQFVGPFREEVTRWEKNLSLVGEVIDVWIVVQRKWM